jgi:hypothetical protein
MWASLTDTPAYEAEVAVVEDVVGAAAAAPLRAPFILGDRTRVSEHFRAAGIPGATVVLHPGRGAFPSIRTMVELDLRVLLPMMDVALDEAQIAEILRRAESALRPFVSEENGKVVFASPAILGTAVKPARPSRDVAG